MSDKPLVVSFWFEPETSELVFDWPEGLKGVSRRIHLPVPKTPEFANPDHIEIFKTAKGIIAGQQLLARMHHMGSVELNPLSARPQKHIQAEQLPLL